MSKGCSCAIHPHKVMSVQKTEVVVVGQISGVVNIPDKILHRCEGVLPVPLALSTTVRAPWPPVAGTLLLTSFNLLHATDKFGIFYGVFFNQSDRII